MNIRDGPIIGSSIGIIIPILPNCFISVIRSIDIYVQISSRSNILGGQLQFLDGQLVTKKQYLLKILRLTHCAAYFYKVFKL